MAKLILQSLGIKVQAYVSQIGDIKVKKDYQSLNLALTEKSAVRCPDEKKSDEMTKLIEKLKNRMRFNRRSCNMHY